MSRAAWIWIGMVASLSFLAVSAGATLDHVYKTHAIAPAEDSLWTCLHHGTQCGATKPEAIEDAWNRRELGYEAADVVALLTTSVAVIALRLRK